jgi:hypothetical protein
VAARGLQPRSTALGLLGTERNAYCVISFGGARQVGLMLGCMCTHGHCVSQQYETTVQPSAASTPHEQRLHHTGYALQQTAGCIVLTLVALSWMSLQVTPVVRSSQNPAWNFSALFPLDLPTLRSASGGVSPGPSGTSGSYASSSSSDSDAATATIDTTGTTLPSPLPKNAVVRESSDEDENGQRKPDPADKGHAVAGPIYQSGDGLASTNGFPGTTRRRTLREIQSHALDSSSMEEQSEDDMDIHNKAARQVSNSKPRAVGDGITDPAKETISAEDIPGLNGSQQAASLRPYPPVPTWSATPVPGASDTANSVPPSQSTSLVALPTTTSIVEDPPASSNTGTTSGAGIAGNTRSPSPSTPPLPILAGATGWEPTAGLGYTAGIKGSSLSPSAAASESPPLHVPVYVRLDIKDVSPVPPDEDLG